MTEHWILLGKHGVAKRLVRHVFHLRSLGTFGAPGRLSRTWWLSFLLERTGFHHLTVINARKLPYVLSSACPRTVARHGGE